MNKRSTKADKKSLPGRLRIVAGNWRSRLLDIADVPGLRPTSERIRETLFNWLAPRIAGTRCLDLFAGTGALGLEALSRGATSVAFVERSRRAVETLRVNVATVGAASAANIQHKDALEFLRDYDAEPFDIVFLDPPFAADILGKLCRLLERGSLLAGDAVVYVEEDRARPPTEFPAGWRTIKTRDAGNVRYSLLKPGSERQGDKR